MQASVANVPARKSWRKLALGLIAFLFLPVAFQVLVPIAETPVLLVPVIAVCALIGWLAGGKPLLAAVWIGLAIPFLLLPGTSPAPAYDAMARGWALILAGSFGLVSLWSAATPFFARAMAAVGLAIGAGFIIAIASPGGFDRFERAASSEFSRRSKETVSGIDAGLQSPFYCNKTSPAYLKAMDWIKEKILKAPALSAILLPAALAIESLLALALGWAVYERIGKAGIGPALSPLRAFRFSDQLVWGVAVGATLLLLPAFEEGKNAGLNLLVFFGALYFVRGLGVLAWLSRRRAAVIVPLAIISFFVPLLFLSALVAVLGIGLGDTWLDWRSRPAT